MKKFLAVAVTLAMVAALVPGMTVSVSAAEGTSEQLFAFSGELVFAHTNVEGDQKANYETDWSSAWEKNNEGSTGAANINWNWDALQVYGAAGLSDTVTSPGYGANDEYFALQFRATADTNIFHDVAIKDNSDKIVDVFRFASDGIWPGDGWNTYENGKEYTESNNKNIGGVGVNGNENLYVLIVVRNINSEQYVSEYYTSTYDGGPYVLADTLTYKGQQNGFKSLTHTIFDIKPDVERNWYNNVRYHNLKIYAGNDFDSVMTSPVVQVISGNEPILPTDVTWNVEGKDFTNDTDIVKNIVVDGTKSDGTQTEIAVAVLPETFSLENLVSKNQGSGYNNYLKFPIPVTGKAKIEFDLTWKRFTSNQVIGINNYESANKTMWGGQQIQLGTNHNGEFTANSCTTGNNVDNNRNDQKKTLPTIGKYRVFVETDIAAHTYTIKMTDSDGNTVVDFAGLHYRLDNSSIDSFWLFTNGDSGNPSGVKSQDGDMIAENIKVYAPDVANQFKKYSVHFEGVNRPDEIVSEVASKVDNLPANPYLPSYKIPYIEGYVFKDYVLNGTDYTLTYEKSSDSLGTWFTRNNLSSPEVSLNMMNFLGAHDAFTAKMSTVGDAAGAKTGDSGSQSAVSLSGSVVGMSKTQEKLSYELLNAGVRYFDIRLSVSDADEPKTPALFSEINAKGTNGEYYTTHGLLVQPLKTIFYTIRDFCKENPGEIIVLDFQTLYNALDAYGKEGSSCDQNWDDVYKLLVETGVSEFMVSGNTSPSGHTWSTMTDNGAHAAVVCFGQKGSQNTQAAHFISADTRRAGSSGGAGYLYSYFNKSSPNSYNNLITDIQNNQVANIGNETWPFRIMQAIYGSSPVSNAKTTTAKLITNENFKSWIKALPVVMMDNAAVDTEPYLKLFATFNRDGEDETYTTTVECVTVEGPTVRIPFSTKLTATKTGKDYTFKLTQFENSVVQPTGEVTLTFPDATGGIGGLKTVVYHDGEKYEPADGSKDVKVSGVTSFEKPFTVTTEAVDAKADAKLGYDGANLTLDFTLDDITSKITGAESFEVTVSNQDGVKVGEADVTNDKPNVILTPKDSNTIYTAVIEAIKDGASYSVGTVKASLYSEVVENLEALKDSYSAETVNSDMIAKANEVISHGGIYFTESEKLNEQTNKIVDVNTETTGKITVTVNSPYSDYGIGFILADGKVVVGSTEVEASDEAGKVYQNFTVDTSNNTVTLSGDGGAVTLSLDSVNIEFVETLINETAAEGADSALDFVPEL